MKMPKDQKVYVIGMSGIEEELHEEGVSFTGGTVSESKKLIRITPSMQSHFRIQPTTPWHPFLWQISLLIPKWGPCYVDLICTSITRSCQRPINILPEIPNVNFSSQTRTARTQLQEGCCQDRDRLARRWDSRWAEIPSASESQLARC